MRQTPAINLPQPEPFYVTFFIFMSYWQPLHHFIVDVLMCINDQIRLTDFTAAFLLLTQ